MGITFFFSQGPVFDLSNYIISFSTILINEIFVQIRTNIDFPTRITCEETAFSENHCICYDVSTMRVRRQNQVWKKLAKDAVRIRVPKSFLPTLTLFFHHISDAMAGDDRPDHGLTMIRQDRDAYRYPFYVLYGALSRAEKRMTPTQKRRAWNQFAHNCERRPRKTIETSGKGWPLEIANRQCSFPEYTLRS